MRLLLGTPCAERLSTSFWRIPLCLPFSSHSAAVGKARHILRKKGSPTGKSLPPPPDYQINDRDTLRDISSQRQQQVRLLMSCIKKARKFTAEEDGRDYHRPNYIFVGRETAPQSCFAFFQMPVEITTTTIRFGGLECMNCRYFKVLQKGEGLKTWRENLPPPGEGDRTRELGCALA